MIIMALKQSNTEVIKRSLINFAGYNPRKKSEKVVNALKKNFIKVGFLGGVVWNKTTGNLVGGHKRIEALDSINGYDPTTKIKDYDIKVEVVELDEKTEREQNIFLNNKRVQGEMDYELMAAILPELDIEATGLEQYDIDIIKSLNINFEYGNNETIENDSKELKKTAKEKSDHVKDVKRIMKDNVKDNQRSSYFSVVFDTYENKAEFLEQFGINADTAFIKGEDLIQKINQ